MEAIARLPSNPNSHNPNPERSSKTSSRGRDRGSDYYKFFIPPRSTDAPNGTVQEGKGIQRVKKKSEGEQGWVS
jgi:hypothetical protein